MKNEKKILIFLICIYSFEIIDDLIQIWILCLLLWKCIIMFDMLRPEEDFG